MNRSFSLRRPVTLLIAMALSACSAPQGSPVLNVNGSRLVPAPAGEKSSQPLALVDQIRRFRGQTEFATAIVHRPSPASASPQGRGVKLGGSGSRAEQEADVFKIGQPGSKLLYLLNNARGLQVVGFKKGPDQPELLGRVEATGNYPNQMYADFERHRLIVLERLWYDDSSSTYSNAQSRLLVYDVSNPVEPKIAERIPVRGEIADSRIVGDVLYIASSIRPETQQNDRFSNSSRVYQGAVTSFDLRGEKIEKVEETSLSLPAAYGDKMSIQSTTDSQGTEKYFLVAVLSETGWGWWDNKSLVEVVDISDPHGKIAPVMTVSAKGRITERSQTLIKDDVLIVTSNYRPEPSNARASPPPARIAVETFHFPSVRSEVITPEEAEYRRLHIVRETLALSGDQKDKARAALLKDETLGLSGRFVRVDKKLRKVAPDNVVTVGDTTGQSASLQDVRYQDGLLFAFWVPANNIDPLDIFDIRHPEKGVTHLSRLHFDGWISKAVPILHKGRIFVLGLGWMIPAVNNESNRRVPQAMIFEIRDSGSGLRAFEVAQLTMSENNVWTDFNAPDRYIEIRESENGSGQILFSASMASSSGEFQTGGKILNFDMSAAANGKPDVALSEGSFLAGRSDWLRRVFTNSEIDRINTFSDRMLGVYDSKTSAGTKMVRASSVLELARQVRDYQTLRLPRLLRGVQIISDSPWMTTEDSSKTILRLTLPDKADAEHPAKLSEIELPGTYEDSLADGSFLYLLASRYENTQTDNGWQLKRTAYVHVIALASASRLQLAKTWEMVTTFSAKGPRVSSVEPPISLNGSSAYGGFGFLKLENQDPILQAQGRLYQFSSSSMRLSPLQMSRCVTEKRSSLQLKSIQGRLFWLSSQSLEVPELPGATVVKSYLAEARLTGHQLECGEEINIPGQPVSITGDGGLMTIDTWTMDHRLTKVTPEAQPILQLQTVRSILGLRLQDGRAVLTDEQAFRDSGLSGTTHLRDISGKLVRVAESAPQDDGSYFFRRTVESKISLDFIGVDGQGLLTKESFALELKGSYGSILTLVADSATQTNMAAVRSGRSLQVVKWSASDRKPKALAVVALDERLERRSPQEVVTVSGFYGTSAHYTPEQKSFEISEGLSGIRQIFLSEEQEL